MKNKKKAYSISHNDKSLGKILNKEFTYGDNPWTTSETYKPTTDEISTRNTNKVSGSFKGNFSVIGALGSTIKIGISHSSHRAKNKVHVG